MTTRGLIEGRDPHQPVHAGLSSQQAVGIFALNPERYALQTSFLTRLIFKNLGLKSALLSPLQIHAQEHLGPILGFGATCSRMDRADGVAEIVFACKQHFGFSNT